jgi:hypothetical protein
MYFQDTEFAGASFLAWSAMMISASFSSLTSRPPFAYAHVSEGHDVGEEVRSMLAVMSLMMELRSGTRW